MATKLITIKSSEKSRHILRVIAAETDELQWKVLERILEREVKRREYEGKLAETQKR